METHSESAFHRSVVEVKVIGADGAQASVIGALPGLERVEKIVRINGRGVDMRATGLNIFLRYTDAPGALGTVGSMLGERGINIEAAALTQAAHGDEAMLILRVQDEVPEDLLASIAEALKATAFQLSLN